MKTHTHPSGVLAGQYPAAGDANSKPIRRAGSLYGLTAALTVMVLSTPAARGDISVSLAPSSSTVNVGEFFTVDILADIDAADAITGWGMDVTFDTFSLGHNPASDVSVGPAFTVPFVPDGDGLAGVLPFGFPPAPPVSGSSVLLATMTFQALDAGTFPLLGGITLGDATEGFFQLGGGTVGATFDGGSIHVVPAASASVLGLLGLSLVARFRRRLT